VVSRQYRVRPKIVTEQRLYQLIRQPKPIADRQFEIEFIDTDVEAFAFTFG
jgi:Thioredoxin like C-terminal domain